MINWNKFYKIIIGIFLIFIILMFIYFKRENNSLLEENLRFRRTNIISNKKDVDSLKNKLIIGKAKLDSIDQILKSVKLKNNSLREQIGNYEKIRYYNDVDSDMADSIISNSNYRYNIKNDNFK